MGESGEEGEGAGNGKGGRTRTVLSTDCSRRPCWPESGSREAGKGGGGGKKWKG
jgi:hypothetical protein